MNFLHDFTLFVIDIHQNMPISLILTPFDHFQNMSSGGIGPDLILTLCHSHIGCICLIFLHCLLSNVSSNSLHEKMHCHIGCIRLTFLHCDISDIRINIYFLMSYGLNFWVRCASGNVSNVSSNRLHEKMQVTLVAFV